MADRLVSTKGSAISLPSTKKPFIMDPLGKRSKMATWKKYWLLQIPGWIILGGLLIWSVYQHWISLQAAVGVFLLWVLKDLVLYPFLRRGYESDPRNGAEQLVGYRGVARERLDPEGYIKVRGELWRAKLNLSREAVEPGTPVHVVGTDGLRLLVTAEEPDPLNLP